jgi:environmental stress-induced protein Ves
MTPVRIDLRTLPPQPWKNGAGITREIAVGRADANANANADANANAHARADADAFDWRVSVAEVARDAPFSAFPGIDRCIVLLRGAGLRLRSRDGRIDQRLTRPLAPFHFSGDDALDATLIDGATSDLNVMTRRGVFTSHVSCHRSAAELPGAAITLLVCSAGEWQVGADAPCTLAPLQALLWRAPVASIPVRPLRSAEPAALLQVRLCHDHRP